MFKPADPISLIAFLTIVAGVLVAYVGGTLKAGASKRQTLIFALGITVWLSILSIVVFAGFIDASSVPSLMMFFMGTNLVGVLLACSSIGRRLSKLPLSFLVAFQGFRLPLELVLHSWARQGVIPETMTWTGCNFDILAGSLALIAAPFVNKFLAVAWAVNIVGFLLLLNVMRVAILSSPLPFAWNASPSLNLVFHVPYFLIAPVCVAGALAGHIILTRKLVKT